MFIEPVFGKDFFGREEVLGTLRKRVTSLKGGYRQNMALAGPMLSGKSSILRHFLHNIDDETVVPLYIDLDGIDFRMFCNRFMATLLFNYLKVSGESSGGETEELIERCRSRIPLTVEKVDSVLNLLKKRKKNKAYENLLELTSIFKLETGKNCVVILDEFHNISNFHLRRPFQIFGKFIMVQKNTMYVVSSSQRTLLKEILMKKLSLLFGNFELIDVNGFDNQTSCSFVSRKSRNLDLLPDIKDYMIQLSEGNPFYLEMLTSRFNDVYERSGASAEASECLLETFSQVLYNSDSILYQYFSNIINFFLEKKTRKRFIPLLISLSKGNCKIKDIKKDLRVTDSGISTKLQVLQSMDIVYNCGVFYKITDKLFEFWLKNVYSLKLGALVDDIDIKYLEFKEAVLKDHEEYTRFSGKSLDGIIRGLFASFNNEKVRINSRNRKMPSFKEVSLQPLRGNSFQITAGNKGKCWICLVKHGDIADEEDINSLSRMKSCRKGRRVMRKICIPLKKIDQNAFLLAKEQNIWVWDIKQLNSLLRLYGEYEIVL